MATEDDLQDVEVTFDPADLELAGKKQGETESKTPESAPRENKQGTKSDDEFAQLRDQVENYRKSVEIERQRREEAERVAVESHQAAQSYRYQAQGDQLTTIAAAIRSVEAEASHAERFLQDALVAGDTATAAKAQRAIAAAEAKLLQLNNGKAALEERLQYEQQARQRAPQQEQQSQQRQQTPEEQVLELADRMSPASRDWVKAHLKEMSDPATFRKVQAAHNAAVDLEGLQVDSPEYFARIEQLAGFSGREGQQTSRRQDAPARKPTPAAPVQSGSYQQQSSGRTPTSIRLSAAMREIAHISFPDVSKAEAERLYAMNRVKMIQEGKINE